MRNINLTIILALTLTLSLAAACGVNEGDHLAASGGGPGYSLSRPGNSGGGGGLGGGGTNRMTPADLADGDPVNSKTTDRSDFGGYMNLVNTITANTFEASTLNITLDGSDTFFSSDNPQAKIKIADFNAHQTGLVTYIDDETNPAMIWRMGGKADELSFSNFGDWMTADSQTTVTKLNDDHKSISASNPANIGSFYFGASIREAQMAANAKFQGTALATAYKDGGKTIVPLRGTATLQMPSNLTDKGTLELDLNNFYTLTSNSISFSGNDFTGGFDKIENNNNTSGIGLNEKIAEYSSAGNRISGTSYDSSNITPSEGTEAAGIFILEDNSSGVKGAFGVKKQ